MARESWVLVSGQTYTPEDTSLPSERSGDSTGSGNSTGISSSSNNKNNNNIVTTEARPPVPVTSTASSTTASMDPITAAKVAALSPSPRSLIRADLLIPGIGDPIKDGALVYAQNESIHWVGEYSKLPSEYKELAVSAQKVPVLMPGLWDCHVHYTGSQTVTLDNMLFMTQTLAGARIAHDLASTLNAGFTSVRELAGHGWAVRQAVDDGWIPGPNVYSSVSMLSVTAGHGDCHMYPIELVHKAAQEENIFELCDGVDECVKAVRKKLRQGADIIKIAASGGVLSRLDDPIRQQFSEEEIAAMVKEAAKYGRIVTAHCHGKAGIMAALRAGCLGIEHGTWLDEEAISLMKEKGAMLVSTRSIASFGTEHPDLLPPAVYKKMVQTNETHAAAYVAAIKAGVKIALGTDLGVSNFRVQHNHGMHARELVFATIAGMTPLQAIQAATANAPHTLGPELAPKSGQLKVGYDADFIAVSKNPAEDVKVLLDTDNVTHVWKAGTLFKEPGKPVGFKYETQVPMA